MVVHPTDITPGNTGNLWEFQILLGIRNTGNILEFNWPSRINSWNDRKGMRLQNLAPVQLLGNWLPWFILEMVPKHFLMITMMMVMCRVAQKSKQLYSDRYFDG